MKTGDIKVKAVVSEHTEGQYEVFDKGTVVEGYLNNWQLEERWTLQVECLYESGGIGKGFYIINIPIDIETLQYASQFQSELQLPEITESELNIMAEKHFPFEKANTTNVHGDDYNRPKIYGFKVGFSACISELQNRIGKKEDYPVYDEQYLKECIKKATPGLSKIKDVDKALDEIREEQPEQTADLKDVMLFLELHHVRKDTPLTGSACATLLCEFAPQRQPEIMDDLKQYITNLLYFAHGEEKDELNSHQFDKWVEEMVEGIDEYLNSK